jgi:hypothetical protein
MTDAFDLPRDASPAFTADALIQAFGDGAYHRGVEMVIVALQQGDADACRQLRDANIELMRRGYHKKPRPAE